MFETLQVKASFDLCIFNLSFQTIIFILLLILFLYTLHSKYHWLDYILIFIFPSGVTGANHPLPSAPVLLSHTNKLPVLSHSICLVSGLHLLAVPFSVSVSIVAPLDMSKPILSSLESLPGHLMRCLIPDPLFDTFSSHSNQRAHSKSPLFQSSLDRCLQIPCFYKYEWFHTDRCVAFL